MTIKRTFNGSKITGYTDWSNLDSQPAIGAKRRLQNFTKRLSIGFAQTDKEYLPDGMKAYARNRNSKGKYVPVLYTLTYPSNEHWQPTDITNFCRGITRYAQREWGIKLRYFWVSETTKTGVIHYHLVTWIPRRINGQPAKLPKASEKRIINGREHPPLWKYRAEISGVRKGVYTYLLKYMSKGCLIEGLGISRPSLDSKGNQKYRDYNGRKKPVFIKPRLFGYGGFTPHQREYMSHCMLPKYVKNHFWSVEYGDKVQRIKGGWQLKKKNPVSKIYKYFQYGNELLKTNFNLWVADLNGHKIVGYDYGVFWSSIPEKDITDKWFPF